MISQSSIATLDARICSSSTAGICKYFSSPHGCVRGGKCFYAHCEEEHRHVKQGTRFDRSPSATELKRRIFVGGLPPLLTSG